MMDLMSFLGWSHLAASLLVIALAIPLVLQRVPPNRTYGVRLKESLQSSENWYRINYAGGWFLIFWASVLLIIALVMLMVRPSLSTDMTLALGLAPAVIGIAAWQTQRYARKVAQENDADVFSPSLSGREKSDPDEQ
jgi:ABC-type Fe3+ transport system permease subunit